MSVTIILSYWSALSVVGGVCWSIARTKDKRERKAMLQNIRALRRSTAINCKAVSRETFGG